MKIRRIADKNEAQKKRVAAYARVSTASEEQQTSFDTQVCYYEKLIRQNPRWRYIGVYADDGSSGISAERPEFKRMITDALGGNINIILVKSISRFARNVVDAQRYVHELRSANVEVRFEREGISSFDPSSDMVFSLLAAVAQEESRVISENTKWSYRKNAEHGVRHIGNNRVLGYDEVDGVLTPNKDAWIVRLIFNEYADGAAMTQIANKLTVSGAKRLRSDKPFTADLIGSILDNEIYTGDRLIQKQAPKNLLTKRPDPTVSFEQYYVTSDHKEIISKDLWEKTQLRREAEKDERNSGIHRTGNSHFLYGKIFCAECGAPYKRRTAKGYDGGSYKLWNCAERQKGRSGNGCKNHGIREDELLRTISERLGQPWNGVEGVDAEMLKIVKRIEVMPSEIKFL